jgi:hypothetical protein
MVFTSRWVAFFGVLPYAVKLKKTETLKKTGFFPEMGFPDKKYRQGSQPSRKFPPPPEEGTLVFYGNRIFMTANHRPQKFCFFT